MPTPVILLVDDEALLRMLVADHFAEAGFEVLEAANGGEAIALLNARPDIQAVVTDVNMPGEPDGFVLSHIVRKLSPDCVIVVVSGMARPTGNDLADRAHYVPKPYRGEDVVQLVQAMLIK